MSKRFPQPVIDKICHLLRTTNMSFAAIAAACRVSHTAVSSYQHLVEPEFRRRPLVPVVLSPETQIAIVADAVAGLSRAEAARRNGVSWDAASRVYHRHAETIEAARAEPAPVAKPARVADDWIAADPALKRSIDRLRAAKGIIPVSEYA